MHLCVHMHVHEYTHMHVYMYVCMYVCMYVYVVFQKCLVNLRMIWYVQKAGCEDISGREYI